MGIRHEKVILDTRIYQVRHVSKEAGRKVMEDLWARGDINPLITGTRRRFLSFGDAEKLANAL